MSEFQPEMWRKIMRYHLEHQRNPDKYPEWRNTWEWTEFMGFLKSWISAFFSGDDSILGNFVLFLLNNPMLAFIIGVGFAYFSFNCVRSALKTARSVR